MQGEQDSFQVGSLLGSAVEGAIIGGVGAIPGVGLVGTVIAGGVGGAANSAISQQIDEGAIDISRVTEEGIAGAVSGGIGYGFKHIGKTLRGKNIPDITDKYASAAKELEKNIIKMQAIKEVGKTPSSLTRKTQQLLEDKVRTLLKEYLYKEIKKGILEGTLESTLTVVGVKTGDKLLKELVSILLPIYKEDDEETVIEFFKNYLGKIGDKLTSIDNKLRSMCDN